MPPRRERQGWLVLALLFAVGIGSGIYVGANRSWDGLSEQAILAGSGKESVTGLPPPTPAGEGSSGPSGPSEAVGTTASPETADHAQPGRLVSEIDQWKVASKSNAASAYEDYLREYPQGRYAAIARLRLQRLQAAAAPPSQPAEVVAATPAPLPVKPPAATPPRAAPPTAEMPAAPATAAKDAKVITGRREEAAWTTASAIHSTAAYRDYLHKYPKGGYAALARDRLATMQAGAAASSIPSAKNAGPQQPPAAESAPVAGKSPEASPPTPAAASSDSSTVSPPVATPPASGSAAASPPAQEAPAPQAALKPQEPVPAEPMASSSGKSALRFDDQTITGDFSVDRRSGLVSGKVKISWSNGNQFEGTLVQGSKEGKGKFTWSSGQRYNGEWIRDMPNGKGTFIFPDGSRYEGEVKDGLPHGQGSTRFKNGIVYTGDWVRGKSHGHGRYIWTDGSYWEGEFRDDKKTDNGKMHFPSKNTRELSGAAPATDVRQEVENMAASASTGEK
ncbi:hypothetical protein [Janthinobacterium sp. 17J80-10]|uniref:MORN repeat-containing protein n=1 Tax=Janthinobacterium sp. 17J80-10 TaxID=2497863 RepID=UPI0010053C8E|nr:hypothetical protein [Janthinobacterium sp. 17J80-10]QAU34950.1 hypothetical protein EKL02_12585 [Janthinobacterium sp. 17J80-10]